MIWALAPGREGVHAWNPGMGLYHTQQRQCLVGLLSVEEGTDNDTDRFILSNI